MTLGCAPRQPARSSFPSSLHPFSWVDQPYSLLPFLCVSVFLWLFTTEAGTQSLCLGRSLPSDCDRTAPRSLAGTGVRMRALASGRQAATMAEPAVRTDFHEPFDIERDFLTQVAFHPILLFDDLADLVYFIVVQLANFRIRADAGCG